MILHFQTKLIYFSVSVDFINFAFLGPKLEKNLLSYLAILSVFLKNFAVIGS